MEMARSWAAPIPTCDSDSYILLVQPGSLGCEVLYHLLEAKVVVC